jgi:hypothetical protein
MGSSVGIKASMARTPLGRLRPNEATPEAFRNSLLDMDPMGHLSLVT